MAWTAPRTWVAGETVTAALLNVHLRDNLNTFSDPWTAYTPTWTATTTNPTLGNGSIEGAYILVGRLVIWRMKVVFGSTTSVGSGLYQFTLPVTANDGTGHMTGGEGILRDDSAVAYMPVVARIATNTFDLVTGAGARVQHATPWAWATNDTISVTGVYQGA